MLDKHIIHKLKKYRHLIAGMIYESVGYFTPLAALRAIEAHQNGSVYRCEWYGDIAMKRTRSNTIWNLDDSLYRDINHDVIRNAIRKRHMLKKAYQGCLAIVDRNINGNESIGASWF